MEFILDLPITISRRVRRMVAILERRGHEVREPYSKAMGNGLFELRIKGKVHIRMFYFYHNDRACFVHAVIKKQQKLMQKDIVYASKVMNSIIAYS
jgi:phage-related protein